ncbi:ImuA family protein [Dyadobacter luticola]|uniref:Error-prone repair protein ImuA n=1 Tax=Dyadobacter luticola TaxID=1979387 RepID=A0A5R9L1I7_9BACT|nr:Error-prone repair protein ImuA [Dyadobacter luticola]TLV02219.1 Error-prone repair protein ImuA [Dyadobacter luticola]
MEQSAAKSEIAERLRKDILSLEGFHAPSDGQQKRFGLGEIEKSFPNGVFPTGAVHEFTSLADQDAASTCGFMAGLLGKLMHQKGPCLWISMDRMIFPPALKFFGVEPDRVIFIDIKKKQDLLWAIEESLKCEAISAVVGEISEITLTESRRLQLAVEQSRVTGFLHRPNPRHANTLASVSRWKITPIPSQLEPGMPGVGHPRWNVQLLKVRNGEPGEWNIEWSEGDFHLVPEQAAVVVREGLQKVG